MDQYGFLHPRLNFGSFKNLDADPSNLVDKIQTELGSADSYTDTLRIEQTDAYGPSVASADPYLCLNNGA